MINVEWYIVSFIRQFGVVAFVVESFERLHAFGSNRWKATGVRQGWIWNMWSSPDSQLRLGQLEKLFADFHRPFFAISFSTDQVKIRTHLLPRIVWIPVMPGVSRFSLNRAWNLNEAVSICPNVGSFGHPLGHLRRIGTCPREAQKTGSVDTRHKPTRQRDGLWAGRLN